MMDEQAFLNRDEEIEKLRVRIAVLEQQLSEIQDRGARGDLPGASGSVTELALDGFFDQSLVMMFIADLVEGRFLRINRKVCEVIGASEKEILESSFLDRVHPDDRLRTMREMERLVAGEKSIHFRNRHRDANGDYRVFDWTSVADPDGELCFAMAIEVAEL